MAETTVRLLAALMALAHTALWVLASRWGRPGRSVQRRVRITPPVLLRAASGVAQAGPLVYPALVVVAPSWAYEGWLNWSTSVDGGLQALGIGVWAVGLSLLFWAAWTIRRYVDVDGLVVDHDLVVHGPYRSVRHPVYSSSTAVAVGIALTFRSYLVVALTVIWVMTARWWAAAEESLLASPEAFGDAYRVYAERTGRFLPRVGRTSTP